MPRLRNLVLALLVACALPAFVAACSSDEATTTTGAVTTATTTVTTEAPDTSSTAVTPTTVGQTTTTGDGKLYSALTGELVASEADLTKPVTGVMIDNHSKARPQSGMKDAEVVFEAIAEAGITRFLVLYQQSTPELIGPVRSLRIYDIDWAKAFDASISHVGGAPSALAEVKKSKYRDLDQMKIGGYYWRSKDRFAPHNVYISTEKLAELNTSRGYTQSHPAAFSRVDANPSTTPNATSISIHISGPAFDSTFAYDKATNTYARSQGGKAYVDREKGQVSPTVVIALLVKQWQVTERSKIPTRERIGTIGWGKGFIFQNGTVTGVTWKKATQDAQIMFTDDEGNDVPLVRGQTWIVAVPRDKGKVSWE